MAFTLFSFPSSDATSNTRNLRSDTATVNGLTTNQLSTTESSTLSTVTRTRTDINCIASDGRWGIVVLQRSSGGVETTLEGSASSPIAQVTTASGTTVQVSTTAAVSKHLLAQTDSIIIRTYAKLDGLDTGFTLIEANSGWQTEQLSADFLAAATWTVSYWISFTINTNCGVSGSSSTKLSFGISTANTRIAGFQYNEAYVVATSQSLTTTWTAGIVSSFNVAITQSLSTAWSVAEAVTWNVATSLSLATSWVASIASNFSVDLSLGFSTLWNVVAGTFYSIGNSLGFTLNFIGSPQVNWNIALSQSLSFTWTVLTQTVFNVGESLSLTFISTIIHAGGFNPAIAFIGIMLIAGPVVLIFIFALSRRRITSS